MKASTPNRWPCLLTCVLAMVASGDDFSVLRLIEPGTFFLTRGLLPLDDENTDFLEQEDAQSLKRLACLQVCVGSMDFTLAEETVNPNATFAVLASIRAVPYLSISSLTPMRC